MIMSVGEAMICDDISNQPRNVHNAVNAEQTMGAEHRREIDETGNGTHKR